MIVKKNKAQCRLCKDIVESIHDLDFQECSCKAIFVSGGFRYRNQNGGDNLLPIDEEGNLTTQTFITTKDDHFYATNDHCQGLRPDGEPKNGDVTVNFVIPARVTFGGVSRILWSPKELVEVYMRDLKEILNPVPKYIPNWKKEETDASSR